MVHDLQMEKESLLFIMGNITSITDRDTDQETKTSSPFSFSLAFDYHPDSQPQNPLIIKNETVSSISLNIEIPINNILVSLKFSRKSERGTQIYGILDSKKSTSEARILNLDYRKFKEEKFPLSTYQSTALNNCGINLKNSEHYLAKS